MYLLQTRLCACSECDEFPWTARLRHLPNRGKRCTPIHWNILCLKYISTDILVIATLIYWIPVYSYVFICFASLQTQRSSSRSSFRRCFAWSRCSSSGKTLSHPLLNILSYLAVWIWVKEILCFFCLFFSFLDRDKKHLRAPTPSRSFWKKNKWDRCPPCNSCWTHPVCRVTSSLKRWACAPLKRGGKKGPSGFFSKCSSVQWCNPTVASPVFPSDAVLSHGSDAKVWEQV